MDFFQQGRKGGTNRPKKLANWTWRERVARNHVEQVEEGERYADIAEQEKERERNTDIGTVAQKEEGEKNSEVEQEQKGERKADTVKQEERAEEWFEAEGWMPPEIMLQSATA
ncbi:hypothetical protein NDU88_003584 [Pleurodeles waltl]|uniref:Uncharacterized protein n=1 Tax=Pleurodeles waltl TaxID=8319 RepID=A0AAV7LJA7_PLEWA|nr:hypothetical protein NDU88_003584 [Pleurodeles waltl]